MDQIKDGRRHNFFIEYNDIFEIGLSKHALLVRFYLLRCMNGNNQAFPTIGTIAEKCGLGKTAAKQGLAELEEKGMLTREPRFKDDSKEKTSTLYTIINIGEGWSYCDQGVGRDTADVGRDTTIKKTNLTRQKNIITIPSNVSYAEFVNMSTKEYDTLVSKHGEPFTLKCIEVLDNHKGAKGIKYVSDYRAILTWVEDAVRKKHPEVINKPANAVTDVQTTRDLLKRIEGGANDAQQRIGGEIDDWLSNS